MGQKQAKENEQKPEKNRSKNKYTSNQNGEMEYDYPEQQDESNQEVESGEKQQYKQPESLSKRKQIRYNYKNQLAQEVFYQQKEELRDLDLQQYQESEQLDFDVDQKFEKVLKQNIHTNDDIQESQLDENFNYKNAYLGKEGMFSDFTILIGQFYYQGESFQSGFLQTAGNELKRIGFQIKIVYSEDEFIEILPNYHIAWIISNTEFKGEKEKFLEGIKQFTKKKRSLFICADNTPYTEHANLILKKNFSGMYLEGDYYGGQIIYGSEKVTKQKFDFNHAIVYGLNNIHEGITICHPVKMHKDFNIFAYNSKNKPLVLYSEQNENHGRIILDFGFTKLYPDFWRNAGTHQYVSNCAVWLTGIVL